MKYLTKVVIDFNEFMEAVAEDTYRNAYDIADYLAYNNGEIEEGRFCVYGDAFKYFKESSMSGDGIDEIELAAAAIIETVRKASIGRAHV